MVLIDGVKYACERCIRGHRVKSCTHTDRSLTAVRSTGRPTTQCNHCRENRKLKSLHISCDCNASSLKTYRSDIVKKACSCKSGQICVCQKGSRNKSAITAPDPALGLNSPLFNYNDEISSFLSFGSNDGHSSSSSLLDFAHINHDIESISPHIYAERDSSPLTSTWIPNEEYKGLETKIPIKTGIIEDVSYEPTQFIIRSNTSIENENVSDNLNNNLESLKNLSIASSNSSTLENSNRDNIYDFFTDQYLPPFSPTNFTETFIGHFDENDDLAPSKPFICGDT